jgi:hypothetical protein
MERCWPRPCFVQVCVPSIVTLFHCYDIFCPVVNDCVELLSTVDPAQKETNSVAIIPQENYTDHAVAAACQDTVNFCW